MNTTEIKETLRKELYTIEGQDAALANVIEAFRNKLHEDDYLSSNLYNIAFAFNSRSEYAKTAKEKTVLLQSRDIVKDMISWIRFSNQELADTWDENALEIRKCNRAKEQA